MRRRAGASLLLPLAAGLGLAGAALAAPLAAHADPARQADGNASATVTCPGATSGKADGATTSSACPTAVTGTDPKGQIALVGTITYSSCGVVPSCSSVSFAVKDPSGATVTTFSVDEAAGIGSRSASSPTEEVPANQPDGTWTVAWSGDAAGSATFRLAVPPSAPAGPKVDVGTPGQASVSWGVSTPTAASSYALQVDGKATTVTPDCASGSCSGTVLGISGGEHTFTVVASRPDGEGGELSSSASSKATITAAATGDASSTPTAGGSSTPAPGASGSANPAGGSTGTVTAGGAAAGGTTTSADAQAAAAAAAAQHRAQTFTSFAPAAGIAQLPPLPTFGTPSTSTAAGDGEPTSPGTYVPTLPYDGRQTVTEKVSTPTLLGHVTDVASDRGVLESVAAAALVLLLAAHLRVLARRDPAYDL